MGKSKVHMSKELKKKCHVAIHSATTASAAAGAIPLPMADAIPITAAQIGMIIALGKAFDVTLTEAAAKSLISVSLTQQAGRFVAANAIKMIPGAGSIVGGIISASTAAALTETLGWSIADDFYRMSHGEEPENIVGVISEIKDAFNGLRFLK